MGEHNSWTKDNDTQSRVNNYFIMGYSQGSFSNITLEHVTFMDKKIFLLQGKVKQLQPVYKFVHFHDSC